MAMKGYTRRFRPLEILTEEEVEDIHRGTLDVLQETGVRIEHKRALKLFEKNDCKVDYSENRVRFPPGLVEESLRKCPSSYRVKARESKNDLIIGGNTVYFTTFPGTRTVDLNTWEPRVASRKENVEGVIVLDALESVHKLLCYTPYFEVEGIPPVMSIPESVAAKMRYSTKVQLTGYSNDCEIFNIQMAQAAGTEIMGISAPSPPLTYYNDAVESAFRFAEAGLPLHIGTGDIFGGTAPATLAGSTVTNNAEIIAGVVLAQLIKPGTRIIAVEFAFPQNMRVGSPAFGDIGIALHQVAFNQIWRKKYEIPTNNASIGLSSSKRIDFQCGYERAIMALVAALSGVNIIQLHGGIFGEITYHPVQSILDDDVAGMIGRFIEGIEVNDETMATDLIEEVGPIPGFYLNKEHTRKWWRKEQYVPKAADRLTYPEWMKTGKKSCIDYAKKRMEEILAAHKPTPLTPSQEKDVGRIMNEARKYYKERGLIGEDEWAGYVKSLKSFSYVYG